MKSTNSYAISRFIFLKGVGKILKLPAATPSNLKDSNCFFKEKKKIQNPKVRDY